jgi:hypothetical protein
MSKLQDISSEKEGVDWRDLSRSSMCVTLAQLGQAHRGDTAVRSSEISHMVVSQAEEKGEEKKRGGEGREVEGGGRRSRGGERGRAGILVVCM